MKALVMKINFRSVVFASVFILGACVPINDDVSPAGCEDAIESSLTRTSDFHKALALRWAPVHYQDTDVSGSHGLNGKADYITAINYDNDWVATNNWNNISGRAASAHCYYSVAETSTHYFLIYAFFHPRDWTDNPFAYILDEHENDLEGLLAIIKKDGSAYGSLHGIVTVAHSDFYSFIPSGSPLQGNHETIDGSLTMESFNGELRPVTAQEAKGHGLKAFPYYKINGDGIKYLPSLNNTAEVPSNADDRDVRYKLVDIFEPYGLWEQRFNTSLFKSADGAFKSSYGNGGANAPWNWNDKDDYNVFNGDLAKDPAKVLNMYFKNIGSFSSTYINNKYLGIDN